eukprot:754584-Hanusia_phi.AAC.2
MQGSGAMVSAFAVAAVMLMASARAAGGDVKWSSDGRFAFFVPPAAFMSSRPNHSSRMPHRLPCWSRPVQLALARKESANMKEGEKKPSRISELNSEISRLGKEGQWEAAMQVLEKIKEEGLAPTRVSYNAAMSALTKNGRWTEALAMFDSVFSQAQSGSKVRGMRPDTVTYSTAISACAKGGQWQRAMSLYEDMEVKGIQPNEFTFAALITACEKGGQARKAFEVFEQMQARGVVGNVYTFTAAISSCEQTGDWQKALKLLEEMIAKGIQPNLQAYSAAISACEKAAEARPALGLLERMTNDKIKPDIIVYSAVMAACGKVSGRLLRVRTVGARGKNFPEDEEGRAHSRRRRLFHSDPSEDCFFSGRVPVVTGHRRIREQENGAEHSKFSSSWRVQECNPT